MEPAPGKLSQVSVIYNDRILCIFKVKTIWSILQIYKIS
jgi:hypothetical protein